MNLKIIVMLFSMMIVRCQQSQATEYGNGRMMGFLESQNITVRDVDKAFRDLQTFVMFVGYPRSAHSLVGSILDAHPHAIVANEFHVLARARRVFSTPQRLYGNLMYNSAKHASVGRSQAGFGYDIPNTWQGRWLNPLLVIGDKKGHGTTKHLHDNWSKAIEIFNWLLEITKLKLRIIHVMRNPFDNIATMIFRDHLKSGWLTQRHDRNLFENPTAWTIEFDSVVQTYLDALSTNARFLRWIEQRCDTSQCDDVTALSIDGRQLLASPHTTLRRLCTHVNLPYHDTWADRCADTLFNHSFASRHALRWPRHIITSIFDALQRDVVLKPLLSIANDELPNNIY